MLVSAHTSAGKTVVAEYAFAMALRFVIFGCFSCMGPRAFALLKVSTDDRIPCIQIQ